MGKAPPRMMPDQMPVLHSARQKLCVKAMCVYRVISDDKESGSGKDDRGKLKTVKKKVVQLFGMGDKEEENQAADFEEDDALDALEHEEEDRAEAQEQEKEGEDDDELNKEKLLYWEVRLRLACPTCPLRAAWMLHSCGIAHGCHRPELAPT